MDENLGRELRTMSDDELHDFTVEWQQKAMAETVEYNKDRSDPGPVMQANTRMRSAWEELDRRGLPRP